MVERLALVVGLSLAAVIAYHTLRRLHMRRMRPGISGAAEPTLLYFRGDHCAVCPTQGRIIDQAVAEWDGRVRVARVDAEREPETAARYRVFTLPTTIWLDGDGRVRHVNYGLTDAGKLARQAVELVARPQPTDRKSTLLEPLPGSNRPSAVGGHQTNILDKGLS